MGPVKVVVAVEIDAFGEHDLTVSVIVTGVFPPAGISSGGYHIVTINVDYGHDDDLERVKPPGDLRIDPIVFCKFMNNA